MSSPLENMYDPNRTLPEIKSFARVLTWVNGVPSVGDAPILQETSLRQLVPAVLSLPYIGRMVTTTDIDLGPVDVREIEPEFLGMTNGEVMLIKLAQKAAAGDGDTAFRLLERVLGKPRQQTENLNVNTTYAEYLDDLPEMKPQKWLPNGLPIECQVFTENTINDL